MKEAIKKILKKLKIYHPLQTFYRSVLSAISNNYFRYKYAAFKGRGFQCNFCYAQYEKFVPEYPSADIKSAMEKNKVIAGFGENVYCPNCMSKNRERLIKAVVESSIDIKGSHILHFSPEKNLFGFLKKTASVQTADITPGFYHHIDKNIVYANATRLPFPDQRFDLVIANHILEHIPEDRLAMKEFFRVLKNNGTAILQVPFSNILPNTIEDPYINDPAKQALLFGQKDHVRIYAFSDYITRLQSAGFSVHTLFPSSLSSFRIHAIQEEECVFLCQKK